MPLATTSQLTLRGFDDAFSATDRERAAAYDLKLYESQVLGSRNVLGALVWEAEGVTEASIEAGVVVTGLQPDSEYTAISKVRGGERLGQRYRDSALQQTTQLRTQVDDGGQGTVELSALAGSVTADSPVCNTHTGHLGSCI